MPAYRGETTQVTIPTRRRTPDGTPVLSFARACRCKSIRWFDDLGTRSNRKVRRKFSDIGETFAATKPCPSASLGMHSCCSADSSSAELVCRSGNKISRRTRARGKIGAAVPLKIIAPPCCSDRLHSGFNLVRPFHLRARAYLPNSIAHRDMNKDGTPGTNGMKLICARGLITLFPIRIAPVTEILSDVAVSFWQLIEFVKMSHL